MKIRMCNKELESYYQHYILEIPPKGVRDADI